ncbi:hypothetical protein [Chitinilyticum litopenaei]|uniref:hypothetical protein n=1 Tax=Chitinilyticum litopenaei TaxID=1121276 RepID=UPI00040D02DF|nr:hypothetical protein [Chitinilyticum litopenaei]
MNKLYDATLLAVADGQLTIALILGETEQQLILPCAPGGGDWQSRQIGQIGIAEQYANDEGHWRFIPYLEQSLRRCPDLDCHYGDELQLGWRCEQLGEFSAPAHIVPGAEGAFIPDETRPLTLPVPPEFFELCNQFNMSAEWVLRGFIADAAELRNYVAEPRADGYSSNGSDERMLANDYLERAYAALRRGGRP